MEEKYKAIFHAHDRRSESDFSLVVYLYCFYFLSLWTPEFARLFMFGFEYNLVNYAQCLLDAVLVYSQGTRTGFNAPVRMQKIVV